MQYFKCIGEYEHLLLTLMHFVDQVALLILLFLFLLLIVHIHFL
jgi:hypothetical protein